jgi:hypothetical protein
MGSASDYAGIKHNKSWPTGPDRPATTVWDMEVMQPGPRESKAGKVQATVWDVNIDYDSPGHGQYMANRVYLSLCTGG